jgi:pyridoxal phosphate enzyme (YggS family)
MIDKKEALIINIRRRYHQVLDQIAEAGKKSGNAKAQLLVVSKSQPLEVIQAAIAVGISAFGENYADEAVKKIFGLGQTGVEWHMIGHVQSRKAELVAEHFTMLHSLDSMKLAARLERDCADIGRILPVLLEVNVSGEESKFGFPAWDEQSWPDLLPNFEGISRSQHLLVRGLMTMPPYFDDPEMARPYFRKMRRLQEFLMKQLPEMDLSELSMGTSVDYQAAVEEGATYVRVGQAILGTRTARLETE